MAYFQDRSRARRAFLTLFLLLAFLVVFARYAFPEHDESRIAEWSRAQYKAVKEAAKGHGVDAFSMEDLGIGKHYDDTLLRNSSASEWSEPEFDYKHGPPASLYGTKGLVRPSQQPYTTTVVAGRLNEQVWEVEWIRLDLENITTKAVYIVDDPAAPLHLKKNHGRESMVYIRYILDHYDKLNDVTFFMHAQGKTWHNNALLGLDSAMTINMMNRSYVMEKGYVNSRCETYPGCPSWIQFNPSHERHMSIEERFQDMFTPRVWAKLFPNASKADYPEYLSQPCCSQFAVSRDTIRAVPYETYQRIHDWLADMALDVFSGRLMEYVWQYLFLGEGTVCPDLAECYCNLYGICLQPRGEHLLDQWQLVMNDHAILEAEVPLMRHRLEAKGIKPEEDRAYRHAKAKWRRVEEAAKALKAALVEKYVVKPDP